MSVKHYVAILVGICLTVSAPAALRAQGMPFMPAAEACGIKPKQQLVNNGMEALKNAATTKFADQRTKALKDAGRDLTQPSAPMGRRRTRPRGIPGALLSDDRGVRKRGLRLDEALALAPACKDDIGLPPAPGVGSGLSTPACRRGRRGTPTGDRELPPRQRGLQGEPMGFVYIANLFVAANEMDSRPSISAWPCRGI